jgi:hypothetical protein
MIAVPKLLAKLTGANSYSHTFTKKSVVTEITINTTAAGGNSVSIFRGSAVVANRIYKELPLVADGGTIVLSKLGMVMEPGDIISFSIGAVSNVFIDGVEFS